MSVNGESKETLFDVRKCDCVYTKQYCEENVYKLCEVFDKKAVPNAQGFVVFISNPKRACPLWMQSIGRDEYPVCWDYHVIFIVTYWGQNQGAHVYDLDTKLDFPSPFEVYACQTFRNTLAISKTDYRRFFKVIEADKFLKHFASTRCHMIKNGDWLAPPPSYPIVQPKKLSADEEAEDNLQEYICMTDLDQDKDIFGRIMGETEFCELFTKLTFSENKSED